MKHNIVIDYRMNNYSGIGTYIRTIIPEIIIVRLLGIEKRFVSPLPR